MGKGNLYLSINEESNLMEKPFVFIFMIITNVSWSNKEFQIVDYLRARFDDNFLVRRNSVLGSCRLFL